MAELAQLPDRLRAAAFHEVTAAINAAVWRKAAVFEALSVFAFIVAYIWELRFTHAWFWILAVGFMVASHVVHGESAAALGFRAAGFGACTRRFGPFLIGLALALTGAGAAMGTIRPLGIEPAMLSFALYLPWGLFQQYLLNGYFLRRFDMGLSRHAASILASALFCAAHAPNWFLMPITAVAGYGATAVYRRYNNLFFLGLTHATVGFLLFLTVPDTVSHHLRVGPGWFR